jgi:adenine phosphoribosyltransferase
VGEGNTRRDNTMKITPYIRLIENFPKEGINFYDMNSLFASPMWHRVIKNAVNQIRDYTEMPTHILGMESRGFVYGAAIANSMELPFVMVRKPGKLPGETLSESYDLEYGSDELHIQTGIIGHTSRVIIADDLFATGGTMAAVYRLCNRMNVNVIAHTCLLNLTTLNFYWPEINSKGIYIEEIR